MAFSVTNLGTNSNAGTTTCKVTGITVPTGALIVVIVGERSASANAGPVNDDAGNVYVAAINDGINGNPATGACAIYYSVNSLALSSQNITYTKAGATTDKTAVSAFYVTGAATGSVLGALTDAYFSTGTSPTITLTMQATTSLVVGAVVREGGTQTYSQSSGFATPPVAVHTGTSVADVQIEGGYIVDSGSATETFNPSYSGNVLGTIMAAEFKVSGGGGGGSTGNFFTFLRS